VTPTRSPSKWDGQGETLALSFAYHIKVFLDRGSTLRPSEMFGFNASFGMVFGARLTEWLMVLDRVESGYPWSFLSMD